MKTNYYSLIVLLFFVVGNAQIVNIPDANFKAALLEASPSTYIASTSLPDSNWNFPNSYATIDTNGDGEIQVSEAALIRCLSVGGGNISNLEGISAFTNLYFLTASQNNLLNLDLSGMNSLRFVRCSSNQMTSLNLSGMTNLQVLQCYDNNLSTLNTSGLFNLKNLWCSENALTTLSCVGLTNLEGILAGQNNLISLNLTNLPNLKDISTYQNAFTTLTLHSLPSLMSLYVSNCQITDLNLYNLPQLSYLSCDGNQLTNLNTNNLPNLTDLLCSNNQLTNLNLINPNLQKLTCDNNQLTAINFTNLQALQELVCYSNNFTSLDTSSLPNITKLNCNSNPQMTQLFIKRQTGVWNSFDLDLVYCPLVYICANDADKPMLQNMIGINLPNCHINSYCSFDYGSATYLIEGNAKYDGDNNGCTIADAPIQNMKFSITNSILFNTIIANTSGSYSMPVQSGSHTLYPQMENPSYFTVSPASTTVSFPSASSPAIRNFCVVPNGTHHDLEIVMIPTNVARPGFIASYKIKYKNKGTHSQTASIILNFNEPVLNYLASSLSATTQASGLLTWDLGNIIPFQVGEFTISFQVNSPTQTPPVNSGYILNYILDINGANVDETPIDNNSLLKQTVLNSYDPNDKTCLEGTVISTSLIGQYVHYKIRFENTGTFPAQNIVVSDLINTTKFDFSTLQMTDSSHSCEVRMTSTNKVDFIFENINLPFDDANNDGYLVFKIKTKSTLVSGSTISNLANIYFDYNFPITTNTATSTFQTLKNESFELDAYLTIYPNPVAEILNLTPKQPTEIYSLRIYNLLGQQVQTVINPNESVDVSRLTTGSYIVKVTTDKGIFSSKFIKE